MRDHGHIKSKEFIQIAEFHHWNDFSKEDDLGLSTDRTLEIAAESVIRESASAF